MYFQITPFAFNTMNTRANTLEKVEQATPSRMPAWELPPANICEEKEAYLLELEMPGVSKDGIEVTVEANELTIVGRRADQEIQGEVVYRESRRGDYRRTFELDPSIDTTKIEAKMEQGVLRLTLPKAEQVKPHRIQVTD
jgi:HSP20 family protein